MEAVKFLHWLIYKEDDPWGPFKPYDTMILDLLNFITGGDPWEPLILGIPLELGSIRVILFFMYILNTDTENAEESKQSIS